MKKFQGGGGVPRQTTIGGQRHDLAYINPFEADLLRAYGGSGEPGPGGVPAYRVYNKSYNPSTISRSPKQGTSLSTAASQQAAMDREIQRENTPRDLTTAQARARMDKGSNQGPTPTQAAAAQAAAAASARAAAAALDPSTERQREIAARVPTYNLGPASMRGLTTPPRRQGPSKVIASAPNSGAVTSVYQGPRPSGRPSGAGPDPFDRPVPRGGLGDLTNLLGMIPGVPMLIDAAKGAAGDIQMSYYAGGPLRSREEQRRNLQEARNPDGSRMYSDFEIDEYFLVTDETAERARQQAGVRPGGDDSTPYTLPAAADPCPEGYRMDTVTNMCVPADDVTGGTPPVVPGFPDLTRPDPVAVPTVVGSSDYTQMPVTGGVPPLLPGVVPMPEIAGPVNRGFMPSEYGGLLGIAGPDARFTTGMPTDIDPFR